VNYGKEVTYPLVECETFLYKRIVLAEEKLYGSYTPSFPLGEKGLVG